MGSTPSDNDVAKTPRDILAGKPPPKVSVKEPHWYGTIYGSDCVLCGVPDGHDQRVRFPGSPPADPGERFARDTYDWACGSHFC